MYKVLLVDDEALIREAISENIPWEELGFSLMGTCENGRQAIDVIKREQPALLLTDINMPFVDGLELAKFVYENYRDIKVIIVTGYDEFEYAKSAVKYQVLEYILKPVTPSELSETLRRVKGMLDETKESRNDMQKIRSAYSNSIPIVQGRYLQRLLYGTANYATHEEQERELWLKLDAACYNTALIEGDSLEPFTSRYENVKDDLALFSIYNITAEIITEAGCGIVFQQADGKTVIIFMGEDADRLKEQIREILPKVRRAILEFLEIRVTAAVGKTVFSRRELPDSFTATKNALRYRFIVGGDHMIEAEQCDRILKKENFVDVAGFAPKFSAAVRASQKEEIRTLAEQFTARMRESCVDKNRCTIYVQNLVMAVTGLLDADAETLDKIHECESRFINKIYAAESLGEFPKYMAKLFSCMADHISGSRENYGRRQAMRAVEYIEKNYADSSVSLNSVCSELAMSTSYFSALFKNYTGETFIEALTKKRMEKAKILLERTEKRTYEIAELVGYSDAHYFSAAFKKATGKTPRQYAKEFRS